MTQQRREGFARGNTADANGPDLAPGGEQPCMAPERDTGGSILLEQGSSG